MMPEKKPDVVRQLVSVGDYRKTLSIAKNFRFGMSREGHDVLRLAYECMV